ncbi:ATP-binding cassette domain-containing protein [candidate division KSB1 bacterium]|nr:ATP-binding cassette domain-containing protein [candidate division KSB1 bacterium]
MEFAVLSIRNVTFGWDERLLFENISATLEPGQIVLLTGENGVGKTTLLQMIAGMIPHFRRGVTLEGDILIDNSSVFVNPPRCFFPQVAYIPSSQIDFFLVNETPAEEITLIKSIFRFSDIEIANKITDFNKFFENILPPTSMAHDRMSYQQKVTSLLLIYFLQGARLFLIDEILPAFIEKDELCNFLQFFRYLRSLNKSIILVSHQIDPGEYTTWEISQRKVNF